MSRFRSVAVVGVVGWCGALVMVSAQAGGSGAPLTEQQKRGQMQYVDKCSACHQESLKGTNDTPPLTGDTFWQNWETYNANNLLEQIRTTMPEDNPGGLERQTYVDILSYILQFNGVPVTGDLPSDADALKKITIKKP